MLMTRGRAWQFQCQMGRTAPLTSTSSLITLLVVTDARLVDAWLRCLGTTFSPRTCKCPTPAVSNANAASASGMRASIARQRPEASSVIIEAYCASERSSGAAEPVAPDLALWQLWALCTRKDRLVYLDHSVTRDPLQQRFLATPHSHAAS